MKIVLKCEIDLDSLADMVNKYPKMLDNFPLIEIRTARGNILFDTIEEFHEFIRAYLKPRSTE